MTDRGGRSRSVLALTVVLGALGAGAAIASAVVTGPGSADEWLRGVPLAALLAAAGYMIVQFRYRDQVNALDLVEAVLAPTIFALPVPVVVAAIVGAQTVAEAVRRPDREKAAFNIAQWAAAAATGSLVFHGVHGPGGLNARNILALLVAMLAVTATNQLAFVAVVTLARGEPVRRVLRGLAPIIVPGWTAGFVVNTAFGVLFVATYEWSQAAVVLFAVPLFALHWASRGHAAVLADRTRLTAMHRATTSLAIPVDPHEAIPRFLKEVREVFEAEAADLVLVEEDHRVVHRIRAADPRDPPVYTVRTETDPETTLAAELMARGQAARVSSSDRDGPLVAMLAREGWRDCLGTPLVSDGRVTGVLCAYDRTGPEGFEEGELAVLQALALDAAATIQKGALLQTIVEERRKLADIVENASDGIASIASDGVVLIWSPGMEQITGHRAEEMVATRGITALRPRDAAGRPVAIEQWPTVPGDFPPDVQITTRAGEDRWLSCSYTRAPGASLIVVARDITKAREIERMKEEFVAAVSHELRTPLTPIKGWSAMLLNAGDKMSQDQRAEGLLSIMRQAERLEGLLTNLLLLSRIEPRAPEGVVDASAVVAELVEDVRRLNPDRVIRLEGDGAPLARGDKTLVRQVVGNLLSNALRYAPDPVVVRVTGSGSIVHITVIDHGPGIPREQQARIFERFERVGDPAMRQEGVGLGLHIANQLAQAMDGWLRVESTPGEGATFTLALQAA
jgi:PAS domain S-box-containing protein